MGHCIALLASILERLMKNWPHNCDLFVGDRTRLSAYDCGSSQTALPFSTNMFRICPTSSRRARTGPRPLVGAQNDLADAILKLMAA